MKVAFNRGFVFSAIVLLTVACACEQKGGGGSSGASSADQIVRPLGDNVTIIDFNGGKITAKDVAELVNPQIKRLNEETVEAYQQAARRMLVQRLVELEAKAQNKNPQALYEEMMAGSNVTDSDIDAFIGTRPDLKKGLKEGIKDPNTGKVQKISRDDLKRFLGQQKSQQTQQRFVEGLMAKANAKVVLELPRVALAAAPNAPFVGGANAKVSIYEFSDFQCPYCSKAVTMVKQIKDSFGDKIKLSFRHFPLNFHEHARPTALATICAHKQGKFWELHDKVFENQEAFYKDAAKNPEKGQALVEGWASSVGIDVAKMKECLKNPETEAILKKDMDDAEKAGVNGTPTFFVNGRKVQVSSFEEFKSIIDQELAKN